MKPQWLSSVSSALALFALVSHVHSADCNQQSITGSTPSSDDIATFLTNALNAGNICGGQFPPNSPLTNIFNANEVDFNVTRSTADSPVDLCLGAFQNIISQCVQGQNTWGGEWSLNGQFYSINNSIYPENGIVIPGLSTTGSMTISSPTSSSTTPAAVTGGNGGGVTITNGNGPIIIPPQTTTEAGTFSTSFISGVTANTVTTTSSANSGQTILPIWFCPECVAAAAGILIIPEVAPIAGGLIPPPPGFPALAIGPDGQATPTGSTAGGSQPTGDPRTQSQDSGDSTLSTVDAPQVTGECEFWPVGSSKRDLEVYEVVQNRELVIPRSLFKRQEIPLTVAQPLRAALAAIGGSANVANAQSLELVTTRFPRWTTGVGAQSMQNRFITGLEGRVSTAINEVFMGQRIVIPKGGFFRIRWDFDPEKGVHVNAEFGSGTTQTKIAFFPSNKPIVDPVGSRNSVLYQQVINKFSNTLGYITKPNTDTELFMPASRTVEKSQAALDTMAKELAQMWDAEGC